MGGEETEIKAFLKRIKKRFKPKKIILFGSRARGDFLETSDYDLIIVSDEFEKYDFRERIIEVLKEVKKPLRIDVLCYTPQEFEKKKKELGIVKEAVKEGKEIKV